MFWGLILEPNKRYTQLVEKPFHISQAAIDISTGDNEPCQVMVVVDGKNFLVGTLQKNKMIQMPLDLYFKAGDVAFLINGKSNVHLTGYMDPEFEEKPSDNEEESSDEEEEEDDEEEVSALVQPKNKRKLKNSNDASTSRKVKKEKKAAVADSSDDDEDDDEDLSGEDTETQSFMNNTTGEASDSDEDDEEDEEEDEDAEDEDAEDEDAEDEDAEDEDAEENEEASDDDEWATTTTPDTNKDESVDISKLSKNQIRRLKAKLKKEGEEAPQVNGVDKSKNEKEDKPKKNKEAKKEDSQAGGDKKEKKVLSRGVFIEDLKVGSGPAAKTGKTVMVYYEGRLKQNNKMFDKCVKGPGFEFRLGGQEVIPGWNAGVAGMRPGGRRRIVCPPAMAYGAKGSPPVIPPNSTIVFEVELKSVK